MNYKLTLPAVFTIFSMILSLIRVSEVYAQTPTTRLTCNVHTFLVNDTYKLPYHYDTTEVTNNSKIHIGDNIIYTVEINTNNSEQKTITKIIATQLMQGNEPIEIKSVKGQDGYPTQTDNASKSITNDMHYTFYDSAHYPTEYLFKVTANPNHYINTSTLFRVETDHGISECASMHPLAEETINSPTPAPTSLQLPGAPSMVYPADGQTIDLEGAYMFKVKAIERSSGYLFGLFQDEQMVYENYRDTRTLSSNGEFALWETNPAHSKFHQGSMSVWVRALVNNQWTDARIITINLRPRSSNNGPVQIIVMPSGQPTTGVHTFTSTPSAIPIPQNIVTVTDSSASAALQAKVDELQMKLHESQQKQSVLEQQLNQIINWIKSIFPFFK